jgi:hypothetical protein
MTTKYTCLTGEKVSILHRFALKIEVGSRFVEVGFEQALEPGVERLIHEESIKTWKTPEGDVPVAASERKYIIARVQEYCEAKGLRYRVVSTGDEHDHS